MKLHKTHLRLALMVVLITLIVFTAFSMIVADGFSHGPAMRTGERFLQLLRDQDYVAAHTMLEPSLRQLYPTAADLQHSIVANDHQLERWSLKHETINEHGDLTTDILQATLTFRTGKIGRMRLEVVIRSDWLQDTNWIRQFIFTS